MRVKQDIAAGVIFAGFGVLGLALGTEYEFGAARSMGPGYLPIVLCWGLIGLGVAITAKGVVGNGELITRWRPRSLFLVLTAVGVFALTVEKTGLLIAVIATALLSSLASDEVRPVEAVVLALVLGGCTAGLFVYGLSLPISILPP